MHGCIMGSQISAVPFFCCVFCKILTYFTEKNNNADLKKFDKIESPVPAYIRY